MKVKVFIDTNVFIYGFEYEKSNSAKIIELINQGKIEAYVNLRVLKEITHYFRKYYSRNQSNKLVVYLLESCNLVYPNQYQEETNALKGKIKEKDLEQIAATKTLGLKWLISYDRDFKPFTEYKTPKQFLKELGIKEQKTEY